MKALLAASTLLLLPAMVSEASAKYTLDHIFDEYSAKYSVDKHYLKAICYVESNLKPDAIVHNDNGRASYGICQVQMRTARHMGFIHTEKELMHPAYNIKYAAKYLSYNLQKYNGDYFKAIHAYNKGHCPDNKQKINGYVKKVLLALVKITSDNK